MSPVFIFNRSVVLIAGGAPNVSVYVRDMTMCVRRSCVSELLARVCSALGSFWPLLAPGVRMNRRRWVWGWLFLS